MYTRCYVCNRSLGQNDVVPAMPVGRRLAYDPDRGRLWVVCPRCGGWNLTPLEERWEALEACERLFAAASVRASSANAGLARGSGIELLRLGAAVQLDEIANWRYGPRLRMRRRRVGVVMSAAGIAGGAAIGGVLLAGAVTGSLAFAAWGLTIAGVWAYELSQNVRRVGRAHFEGPGGERIVIGRQAMERIRLTRTSGATGPRTIGIVAEADGGALRCDAEGALMLLAAVLPRLNWRGADSTELSRATRIVDAEEAFATEVAERGGKPVPPWQRVAMVNWPSDDRLASMGPVARLALEMAVTEEVERRALAGEAAALGGRWREAEEVASIADSLFLPAFVTNWLARQRSTPTSARRRTRSHGDT